MVYTSYVPPGCGESTHCCRFPGRLHSTVCDGYGEPLILLAWPYGRSSLGSLFISAVGNRPVACHPANRAREHVRRIYEFYHTREQPTGTPPSTALPDNPSAGCRVEISGLHVEIKRQARMPNVEWYQVSLGGSCSVVSHYML